MHFCLFVFLPLCLFASFFCLFCFLSLLPFCFLSLLPFCFLSLLPFFVFFASFPFFLFFLSFFTLKIVSRLFLGSRSRVRTPEWSFFYKKEFSFFFCDHPSFYLSLCSLHLRVVNRLTRFQTTLITYIKLFAHIPLFSFLSGLLVF